MVKIDISFLADTVRKSGFRHKYIADKCGINNRSFSLILKGKHGLSADVYAGICDVLGVPMETFVQQIDKCKRDTEVSRSAD